MAYEDSLYHFSNDVFGGIDLERCVTFVGVLELSRLEKQINKNN